MRTVVRGIYYQPCSHAAFSTKEPQWQEDILHQE